MQICIFLKTREKIEALYKQKRNPFMKRFYLSLIYLLFSSYQLQAACSVAQLYSPRSQGVNTARELAGLTNHINIFDMEKFYGTFAVTPEYTRSFNNDHIAESLFGNSLNGCESSAIRISGSTVANRGPNDWLADYFGLPTDFQSDLTFRPRVTNFLVDFYLYLGLDEWLCGLFCFVHAPVVNSRWDLNFEECIIAEGAASYPAGYFTPQAVPRATLRNSFTEYVTDCNGVNLGNDIYIAPLQAARMSPDSKSDTALADIRFALGWNFLQDVDYHLGLGILGAAPTGSRPKGQFIFEPVVGNGHHWELGALLWGHATFWRSECEEKFLSGWMQANITHMFKAHQYRFFDLQCKPNSRYMLAERMDNPVNLLLANTTEDTTANSTVPNNQFKDLYAPVANLTLQEIDTTVGVQADIVVMLNYTRCGFSWDLGYNFWARTCEKITPNCSCPPLIQSQKWALKGDAYVFGFTNADISVDIPAESPVALSATESDATIHNGTNNGSSITLINSGVDNLQWAVAGENQMATVLLLNQPTMGTQTQTSNNPILLTLDDVDFKAARTKGLSQKVFTHVSYSWLDNEDWTPYLGVGAEVEFAQKDNSCETSLCNRNPCSSTCTTGSCTPSTTCFNCNETDCRRCGLSQWGVWIKGGVSFN